MIGLQQKNEIATLSQRPELFEFEREAEFCEALQRLSDQCRPVCISDTSDVFMNASGKIRGLNISRPALARICNRLAFGLTRLLADVSGEDYAKRSNRKCNKPDPALAARLFNEIVKKRFDRLEGCHLYLNAETQVIDGFGTSSQQQLAGGNPEMITAFLSKSKELGFLDYRFIQGLLEGHQFMVCCVLGSLPTEHIIGEAYQFGYCFSGAETGERGVRVAPCLYSPKLQAWAINPPYLRDWPRRPPSRLGAISRLRQSLLEKIQPIGQEQKSEMISQLVAIQQQPLLSGNFDLQQATKRLQEMVDLLNFREVRGKAKQIISAAATGSYLPGFDREDLTRTQALPEIYSRRTMLDVFQATMVVAKQQPRLDTRYDVAQFAYRLLSQGASFIREP